jgi:hypothetical protein
MVTNLVVGILAFTSLGGGTASALTSSQIRAKALTACKQYQADQDAKVGENNDPEDYPDNNRFIVACVDGYIYGYTHFNENDQTKGCGEHRDLITQCKKGHEMGQRQAKIDAGVSQPSAAEIKQAAEKACKPWSEQDGVSADTRAENFKACVAGYTGQKTGKDRTDTCENRYSGPALSACNTGYDNAIDPSKYPVKPGAGGAGTAVPEPTSGDGASTSEDEKQLDCDAQFDNPLTWIICPVVDTLVGIVETLDNVITDQLTFESNDVYNSDSTTAYRSAWSSMRNIALGLLVAAGLVILISQALGMEILDAYTIRKSLPRLLVATVLITLSWPLMKFALDFTNDLGVGIRHLIYAPFAKLDNGLDISFDSGVANIFFGSLAAGGVAAAAPVAWFVGLGGIGGLLAYLGTAALGVFIAILVLILRQVLIIMLLLFAPIAIMAYILPNTQRVYKLWWESFSKILLMFPLIAAFIATGRVFSAIAIHNGGALNQLIGFVAYFAPYFLIPLTFKFAGGALRQIGGFVNDRGKGGFDRLRNFRGNRRKSGVQRIQTGNVFRGAPLGSRRARINERYQAASLMNPDEIGYNPMNWRNKTRAIRERVNLANALQADEKSAAFQPIKGNDDLMQAALHGAGTRADAREYLVGKKYEGQQLEQALDHLDLARKEMGDPAFRSAAILGAVTASTAYGKDPVTDEIQGIGKLLSDIDLASGGDESIRANLVGTVKGRAQQAGRTDLVAPFSDMFMASRAIGKAGSGDARRQAISAATEKLTDTIVDVEGAGFILGGKGSAVENFLPALTRRVEKAANNLEAAEATWVSVDDGTIVEIDDPRAPGGKRPMTSDEAYAQVESAKREKVQVLAATKALHDVAGQISPEKARLLADGVLGQKMPHSKNATVMDSIREVVNDPEYNQMRNEYAGNYWTQARDAAAAAAQADAASRGVGPSPPAGPSSTINTGL